MKGAIPFSLYLTLALTSVWSVAETQDGATNRSPSTSQLNQAARNFKKCFDYKDLKPRMSCLDKLVSAELQPSLRGKLLTWLSEVKGIEGKLLTCERKKVEALTVAKTNHGYSCGSLKTANGNVPVVLAFASHPKIDGLRLVNVHL